MFCFFHVFFSIFVFVKKKFFFFIFCCFLIVGTFFPFFFWLWAPGAVVRPSIEPSRHTLGGLFYSVFDFFELKKKKFLFFSVDGCAAADSGEEWGL